MATTIASIEVFSFALARAATYRNGREAASTPLPPRPVVLVRLVASDGSVGWGEGSPDPSVCPETRESILSTLGRYFAPAVLGKELYDFDGLHRAMDGAIAPLNGASMPIARAAIDVAAHDALARALKVPLRGLLGRRGVDHVRLCWTVTGQSVSEVEASLQEARDRGYRNCHVALRGSADWDYRLCKLAADAFADGFLWADARGRIAAHDGPRAIQRLADAGVSLVEQPLAPGRWEETARLLDRSPIPVALDEPLTGPRPLLEAIGARALSAYPICVARAGGIHPTRRCIELAESARLMVLGSGMTDAGVGTAANVLLAAAAGVEWPCAIDGPQFLLDDVTSRPLPRELDVIRVGDGVGLGIEVDEEKVRQFAQRTGGTFHKIG